MFWKQSSLFYYRYIINIQMIICFAVIYVVWAASDTSNLKFYKLLSLNLYITWAYKYTVQG